MRYILSTFLWLLSPGMGFAMQFAVATDDIHLASLVRELISNPQLQEELEVFPKQVESLGEVVSKREFKEVLQRVGFGPRPVKGYGDAFMDADKQVLNLLRGVLEPEQIASLRRYFVKSKFMFKFREALASNTVMQFIGVDHISKDYLENLDRVLRQNEFVSRKMDDRRIRQFLALLPNESQRKMAQLVGAKYYDAALVDSTLSFEALPFPDAAKSVEMLGLILSDPDYAGLRLSKEQRASLEKISAQIITETDQLTKSGNFNQELDSLNLRNRQRAVEYFSILDEKQKLTMGRILVQQKLEHNVDLVVKLPGLQSFLEMDSRAWSKFLEGVEENNRRFADERRKLNQEMLESLGKAMGNDVERRLNFLLGDVW